LRAKCVGPEAPSGLVSDLKPILCTVSGEFHDRPWFPSATRERGARHALFYIFGGHEPALLFLLSGDPRVFSPHSGR